MTSEALSEVPEEIAAYRTTESPLPTPSLVTIAHRAKNILESINSRYPNSITRRETILAVSSVSHLPNNSLAAAVMEGNLARLAANRKAQKEILAAANQPPISEPIPQKRGLLAKIISRHS